MVRLHSGGVYNYLYNVAGTGTECDEYGNRYIGHKGKGRGILRDSGQPTG